jgi:hypothetical protein
MENIIKTQNYLLSTKDILAIKKIINVNKKFEGILLIFRDRTTIQIFTKNDIVGILQIFDKDFNEEEL